MKNTLLTALVLGLFSLSTSAQNAHCGFDEHLDRMLSEDPSGMQVILEHQKRVQEVKTQRLQRTATTRGGGVRVIPTVFHIIHQGGSENISMEQIEDQMRIINEDFRRQNADTTNTRPVFLDVAADANVEFRLANKDPMGNCTDGVVRIWSPLTYNASDDNGVKGLSYWDSNKYFNVWVVSSIDNDGQPGIILGYAQFPGFGGAQTDGVVVRSNYVGSIGTGATTASGGRTLTHEIGHWLGLFHTFQGGCTGGFFGEGIDDTPPIAEASAGCPQNANTCSNDNPDLPDQVENYMDYSNGTCQNMYTLGQKDAMDAVLDGSRSQIWSPANLSTTGVSGTEELCVPVARFYTEERIVCVGQDVSFNDWSFNGEVDDYEWDFPGASPGTSGSSNPTVSYNEPGIYPVTLTASNAEGSDSFTETDYIRVIPAEAQVNSYFSFEGFEQEDEAYILLNDNLGDGWEKTSSAAYTDDHAIVLNNFNGNPMDSEDEFMLPSVNVSQMSDPKLYFRVAYRERSDRSDNLRVYVSRNCGENWLLRYNRSGTSLATVSGSQGSPFTPSSEDDWLLEEVSLGAFANDESVLVKFRGTSGEGNNIFIDDIQISGPLSVQNTVVDAEISVTPNPTSDQATVTLETRSSGKFAISVLDVTGRELVTLHDGELAVGTHRFEVGADVLRTSGVYLVSIANNGTRTVRKLVVQ